MNIKPNYDYLKFESNSYSSFRMNGYLPNIQYSLDGETFIDYTPNELIDFDDTLYIQWEGALFNNTTLSRLELQGENIKVSGRLLHGDVPYAYQRLFSSNYNIVDASELVLSSETAGEYAYFEMFSSCKQLTLAPELPATTLSKGCYSHMFSFCTSLIQVPELSATTLAPWCCYGMFIFCTSLTSVPNLIDTDIDFAYTEMFRGCTGLEEFLDLSDEQLDSNVYSGIFIECTPEVTTEVVTFNNLRTTRSVTLSVEPTSLSPTNLLDTEDWICLTNAESSRSAAIQFEEYNPVIYYSIDGENFTQYTQNTTITIGVGGSLYIKWEGPLRSSNTNTPFIKWTSAGYAYCNVRGRLLHGNNDYAYNHMFYSCYIYNASEISLPATTLGISCYQGMFQGCPLTGIPDLPATTLAYNCYQHMYYQCTFAEVDKKLLLPATILEQQCYYGMFWEFAEYRNGNFEVEISATTLSTKCMNYMFYHCKTIKYVKHNIVDWNTEDTTSWLVYTRSNGIVECPVNSTIPSDSANGIPTGWLRNFCLPIEDINYIVSSNGTANVYSSNNTSETLNIPSTVSYNGNTYSVSTISSYSLADDRIVKTLSIESGINTIEASAFSGCYNLETVNIPESVSGIGNHAFWMCRNMKNITLPSALNQLNPEIFVDCISLETITIPSGITTIPFRMFEGCKNLKTVDLPSTITEIQWSAFKDCVSLTTITIPSGCTVDSTAFEGTNITV